MAKPLFSLQIECLDEWVLVRLPGTEAVAKSAPKLLVAEKNDEGKLEVTAGVAKRNHGIVVAVGPGARADNGALVPIDERIKPGATVAFPGKVAFQHPDYKQEMEAEGLWFIPAHTVMFIVKPAGLRGQALSA